MPAVVVIEAGDIADPSLNAAMNDMRREAIAAGQMNTR